MTTTEIIITILLLVSVIGAALCIFLANLAIKELNTAINNVCAREDYIVDLVKKTEAEKAKRAQASERFKEELIKNMKARNQKTDINVLDFPNDRKD